MPQTAPIYFKNAQVGFQIGTPGTAYDMECQVRIAAFMPDEAEIIRYNTLCATGSYVAVGRQTWTLNLTGAQAYGDVSDLARYLLENAGATALVVVQAYGELTAASPTTPAMGANVILVPGAYGGEEGTWLEIEVVLPVLGAPALQESWGPAAEPEAAGTTAA